MKSGKQFDLPKERKKTFIESIDAITSWQLIGIVLLLYIAPVFVFSGLEWLIGPNTHLTTNPPHPVGFWELIYFNFVSILTIGYGDMSPTGVFRLITIVEAVIGLAIYSLSISLVTIKILLPRKDVIVFSKYAYYCTDDSAFMIIYLNTSSTYVTNLQTSWYFKLDEDWHAKTPIQVPFITKSVQTFYLKYDKPFEEINAMLHPFDCLRVGLSGNIGMANYSTFVEYGLKDILIIRNRSVLTKYEGFYKVDENLKSAEFEKYFHYQPEGAGKLSECLKSRMNKNRK
jgi:hypothetical protein